ncbi:MAG: hydrogenase nickel incorporation protein HypB [bacterium]|nr:hydrogenase nickel incorporation protein HypB [bacterium]MDT8395215.1 hydrogenase nickel incorporation protein HypB [bacterium]
MSDTIRLEKKVLSRNDMLAAELRELFREKGVAVMNMVSSPGSGKTSLLEKTLGSLSETLSIGVIEGDIQTENDALRIAATGVPVHQIQTGGACHLEAEMIRRALDHFSLEDLDLLIIENVGNLVCPSAFDLGEGIRVSVISVTEGDDKPLKYPSMFHSADVMVVNKMDLLPYTDFSVEKAVAGARSLNPGIRILETSCRTGEGLDSWSEFVKEFTRKQVSGV